MNAGIYKLIFSKRLNALVVVGEICSSQGKSPGTARALKRSARSAFQVIRILAIFSSGALLVSTAWATPAVDALPTGGQVVQGSASISQSGAQMDINQASQRAVINWQSFDVGADAKVHILQPDQAAVLLNRVVTNRPSEIYGKIDANGQVVLVNNNGIVFGKDGSASAASFTATTLDISDQDFMEGKNRYTSNGTQGEIVNHGSIEANNGGYVALLGAKVSNDGRIVTHNGTVVLGAAVGIAIPMTSSGKIKMQLSASSVNAAVENTKNGVIITEGGDVYLQAAAANNAMALVKHSGQIDTSGEQAGKAILLADNGEIKVDGSITANSTNTANSGGEIVIGRDTETGKLAKATDVSGAKLESKKGFIETSAHQLKTDDAIIKAKDWLLDPDNIDITGDAVAATAGFSKIKASDIATALNAGTSVTVSTTAASSLNQPAYVDTAGTGVGAAVAGDGNILVNAAIVKLGASDASLTLLADNGITVNQRIGKASADTTSTGKLDVTMTALGNATVATDSKGIILNQFIDANDGAVAITGTNKNTNSNSIGVTFNNGSGITAGSYNVQGVSTSTAQESFGVGMFGVVKFKSTGDSLINGTSLSQLTGHTYGTTIWDGADVAFDAGNTGGKLVVKGSNAAWETGFRIAGATTAKVTTDGHVTLGALEDKSQFSFRAGTITANSGSLTLLGQIVGGGTALSTYDGSSITANNGVSVTMEGKVNGISSATAVGLGQNAALTIQALKGTAATAGNITITGTSTNGTAVQIKNTTYTTWKANNISIAGVANTTANNTGTGVLMERYPGVVSMEADGNISIVGTVQGAGYGSAYRSTISGWGAQSPMMSAGGTFTLRANNRASASNTASAISAPVGLQVKAVGNIVIQAETNNAAVNAMDFYSNAATFWGVGGALYGNTSFRSVDASGSASGNVLIQSNQGGIRFSNLIDPTLTSGPYTALTEIKGKNVTIDNTGAGMIMGANNTVGSGSIDSNTGVIIQGSGKSTSGNAGINIADGRKITASDHLNIFGAGTSGNGVAISGASALSANVAGYTGNINIAGENTNASAGNAAINISNASATITSLNTTTLTSSGTGSGTSLIASGNINVGGELQVINPALGTISGVISGTGLLRKVGSTGAGTLVLTGANTYAGGTVANGGTLQVGNGGAVGTLGTGSISVGANLSIKRSDIFEIFQNISGSGTFAQSGTGTTILSGNNTYSGATTISSGVLQVGNGGTNGTLGTGSVTNNASLLFKRTDTLTASNDISGTGTLTQAGTGTTILTGSNSYSGTTTISNGILQVGNGGTTGSLGSGAVVDNASLIFNRSDALLVSNIISGTGALTQSGTGTTKLAANNTYSGVTTVSTGTLQVGNGGTTGSLGTGAVVDNANLSFNRSNALLISNLISGTGSLSQIGTGTTTLIADNSYAGITTVSGGTLQVGNAGSTGALGVGDVTLSNNANLSYLRSTATTINNNISGAGNVLASITGAASDLTANHSINLTGGTVNLVTDGNLSVTQAISTTNATSSAVFLEAGKATAAGTAAGGDVTVSGSGAVTVGVGGRITYQTGSIAGSTGLGIVAGNSRYNSDETITNYTTALGVGTYAIYREAPTLSAVFNNASKTYDGLGYAGGNGVALTGFVNGDTNAQLGTITYTGTSQSAKNVGSYGLSGSAVSGVGYSLAYTAGSLTVNKADLVLSGTRIYDASTRFAGTYLTATGVNGETFAVSGSGDTSNLVSKNLQTNQTLNSVTGLSLSSSNNGGLSTNYNALTTVGSSVSVTAKAATVTGTATNVTYNGSTQSQLTETSSGFISGDAITILGNTSGKNAGTYASNLIVTGADAGNYSVNITNANLVIGKADLTLSGSRIYDASTVFSGADLLATGVAGETFSITGSGDSSNLSSKNVQTNQTLSSVTGLGLGSSINGGLSTNYNTLTTTGSSVSVTAKAASVLGTATNVTYNGSTQNQSAFNSNGFISGDVITISGNASGKNAGTYASNLAVTGTDAGNYNTTITNADLVIAKAALTATGNSNTVTYTAASQSVSGFTVSGLVGSDTVADLTNIVASGASGTNAGSYTNTVTAGTETNYTVNTVNGTLQINKAALTATGNSGVVTYNGYDQTLGGFTVSGLLGADNVSSLSTIQATGVTAKNAGSYTNTVTAGTETNYTVNTVNGSLLINKAALTATGNSSSVTYTGLNQSVSGFTVSGLKGADVVGDLTTISAAGANGANAGSYTNTVSTTGTETNYTVATVDGSLNIGKANLTLSGTRVYDAGTTFAGSFLTANGVNGETFLITGAGDTTNLSNKNVQSNQTLSSLTGLSLGSSSNGASSTNYNALSTTGSSVSVTAKAATVNGTLTNVTYNGNTQNQNTYTSTGFIGGDAITITGDASGKNAGSYASNLVVSGADSGNYNTTINNNNLVIAKAALTVTANQVTKTYDGSVSASGTATIATLAGAAAGDSVNNTGSQAFADKDAGSNKTVTASGVTIKDASNADATANYNINYVDNTTSTINQAALTITANNDARFVTLSDVSGYNGVSYSGFVGGENNTVLSGLLAINRTNAATVAAGNYAGVLVASGLSSNNYNINYQNGDYTILAANQLLIRTNNLAMTYGDSLPVYSTTAQYLDGNNNQIATLTQSVNGNNYLFTDNAGGSVSVTLNPYSGSSLASNSSSGHVIVGNYAIKDANPTASGSLNFTGSPVFVGALTVNTKAVTPSATNVSKVYDGTTSMANVSVGLSGKVTGDTLLISGTGAFSQTNVGTSLGYTISGVTLSGADASNYHLIGGTNSFSGSDGAITAATLKITSSDVVKTYDRTTQALGFAVATAGTQLFGTDSLSGGTFAFSDWNAGVGNKVVNVSAVTVNDGNGGNNYVVSYVDNTTSTINAKHLTASYSTNSKTYDGNATAHVTGSSSDIISGDVVNLANTSATFSSKEVGVGKTVTVTGISISGADAGNYALQNTTATTSADINKKDVSLASIAAANKTYDGNTAAIITAGSIATGVGSETLAVSGSGTFGDKNAATGKTVTVADVTALTKTDGTGLWSNYNLTTTGTMTTTADIAQKAITLSGLAPMIKLTTAIPVPL